MGTLILCLLFCHWVGDFSPLSTAWMLNAKSIGKPLLPILMHASVHGLLMGIVLFFFVPFVYVLELVAIQITSHFFIDVSKGLLNVRFPSLTNPRQYVLLDAFRF